MQKKLIALIVAAVCANWSKYKPAADQNGATVSENIKPTAYIATQEPA